MKLTEAIILLQQDLDDSGSVNISDLNKAQELAIEALNFRLRWEQQEGEDDFLLLPGETKERQRM